MHANEEPIAFLSPDRAFHFTQTYLATALDYLEDEPSRTPAHKIKGIWVASDNTTVVNEVRSLSHAYFPNVRDKDIVYVGGGVPDGVQISNVTTETHFQVNHSRPSRVRYTLSPTVVI